MAEFVYVLFLLSGFVKFFLRFTLVNLGFIDFTLLTAILLACLGVVDIFKNFYYKNKFYIAREATPMIFLSLAFYIWMIATLTYTRSPGYSYTKVFLFLTTLLAFWFPLVYKEFDPKKFFKYLVFFGTVLLILYLAVLPESYLKQIEMAEEEKEFLGKYLDIGYLSGLNILLLLYLDLGIKSLVRIGFIGANLASLVISGARGPLIILALVLFLRVVFNSRRYLKKIFRLSYRKLLAVLVSILILAVGMFFVVDKYSAGIDRTLFRLSLAFDPTSGSIAKRISYMSFAIDKLGEDVSPLIVGYGIGSFGKMYSNEDKREYPHNIILEVWFELGLVGVLILLLFFFFCIRKLKSGDFLFIFLYLLLNSLKSSSLVDLRIMFGLVAALWLFKDYLAHRRLIHDTEKP